MKKIGRFLNLTALLLILLVTACQENPPEPTASLPETTPAVSKESEVTEGDPIEVTRGIPPAEILVTPAPGVSDPAQTAQNSYRVLTSDPPQTFDPAAAYDRASRGILQQTMEGLIFPDPEYSRDFVPQLALEVPSLENGGISADGLTYTFYIRPGVRFHAGGMLEAHDVEYTIERGLLQSQPGGPQGLLLEPLLGYRSGDITEEIANGTFKENPEALRRQASAEELADTCQRVNAAVTSDDESGQVTFHLAQPWAPFLATLAQSWGYILDSEWVIDQGGWDGSCTTWADHYAPGDTPSELAGTINGTGPYLLANWLPGERVVLRANANYWRPADMPLWEGGPGGQPEIETIVVEVVPDWPTQLERFKAGEAEAIDLPPDWDDLWQLDTLVGEECNYKTRQCQPDPTRPDKPFRRWINIPQGFRDDIYMNYQIAPDSPYIGTGDFDGGGVLPNFFSDIHVRRAFNHCFNYNEYIDRVYQGHAKRTAGPLTPGMLGYDVDGDTYDYNLACQDELEQAWYGVLPEVGFRVSMVFIRGNKNQQVAGDLLQLSLSAISTHYQVNVISLLEADFQAELAAGRVPIYVGSWLEEIHDPHNWAAPHTTGSLTQPQNLPAALLEQFQFFLDAGYQSLNLINRRDAYYDLQALYHREAIQIPLPHATTLHYEPRSVQGWFSPAGLPAPYYYGLGLSPDQ